MQEDLKKYNNLLQKTENISNNLKTILDSNLKNTRKVIATTHKIESTCMGTEAQITSIQDALDQISGKQCLAST